MVDWVFFVRSIVYKEVVMGLGKPGVQGGFRTENRRYDAGYSLILDLENDLPRKYDPEVFGDPNGKGLAVRGHVVAVLGAVDASNAPAVGDWVIVTLRPGDSCEAIYDDLEKTREGMRFLLEGVTGDLHVLTARWAHGVGINRNVEAVEFVGAPHLSFENPVPSDGPKNGWLYLNLDGSATEFDVRGRDGIYTKESLEFDVVVDRLKSALEKNLKFRVGQRVLAPSYSCLVEDQSDLEAALSDFRALDYTACVVRSFLAGTVDSKEVDVQFLTWPADVPSDGQYEAKTYPAPQVQETARFVALRDGEAQAFMEVIPGYVATLIGNTDVEKSTKHKFVSNIVRLGLSEGQRTMYGAQGYGPGILINAVQENGTVTGLKRLAVRTQGPQYQRIMNIPSRHFVNAAKVVVASVEKDAVPAC